MKTAFSLLVAFAFPLLARSDEATSIPAPSPHPPWQLVWSDDFKYTGLPDKTKWSYEEGYIRNHELQFYTRDRPENARVENGALIIEGRKDNFPIPPGSPKANGLSIAPYTSACLTSRYKMSALYGRIEARAKLPTGRGVWPAFWTLGANESQVGWPACGEIDIMEFVGKAPQFIHGTVHYKADGHHHSAGSQVALNDPAHGFHIYAVEWYPDRIDFFFDHQKYFSVDLRKTRNGGNDPFQKPQYLLVNLALGGDWGGPMDDSALPQQFQISYVRIYQIKGQPTPVP